MHKFRGPNKNDIVFKRLLPPYFEGVRCCTSTVGWGLPLVMPPNLESQRPGAAIGLLRDLFEQLTAPSGRSAIDLSESGM